IAPPHTHAKVNVRWFLVLCALSLTFLLKTLTSIFTFLVRPHAFAFNLCCGTALFHASLIALRGPRTQLARLSAPERMPHSMTIAISLLAALWASLKKEYWASMLFGGAHFCAFFLDACSHIPGGKQLFKVNAQWSSVRIGHHSCLCKGRGAYALCR
ncbi:MAG: hypothetical protein SGPRY_013126, partial [Prymnesium sp.]